MNGTHLQFYFEWDRDILLRLCATIREVFWPVSVFLVHPLVLFVLIRKTKMDLDCKLAFVVHDTVLAFLTISQCIPYIFVMMRLHQKMVSIDSRAKLSERSQLLLMCFFTAVLVSNVYGFGAWSAESADKDDILNIPDIAWVTTRTPNFLVFGRKYGEIGLFNREMFLLLFTILVCFSFYMGCTYHAIVIGKGNVRSLKSSKTVEIQLRFMKSMAIQACLTSLFFITPLVILGISLATPIAHLIPAATLPGFRIVLVVVFCCCSFGHSIVFLGKSAFIIQKIRDLNGTKKSKTTSHYPKSGNLRYTRKIAVVMDANDAIRLQYYFEWDQDLLLWLCATIREVYWPISVFFIHPLVLFVLIRKTRIYLECKMAFIVHDLHTLTPYPIFCCTGILCSESTPHRLLLVCVPLFYLLPMGANRENYSRFIAKKTVLSFLTISLCAPYLFVMMRLHQKMVSADSRAKLSERSQLLLMCVFTIVLCSLPRQIISQKRSQRNY
ncbi:hypothetical protein PRIPAC_78967 [Pristionchus pacificus]|uniref:G protein-coupled receptor n=1 Tax=Pristionchus pacificus TaxID=54126 RepID=A0A2A6CN75_PRIPA|nr:hypothetical protein PRIPAC_78967 [Pristionchus pacificus]|eukprot:PDM79652.1 G protein-coupled receptor [Pristionchus pacificus]